jgi:phage gp29-like protein
MPATVSPGGMVTGARPLQNPAWIANYSPDIVARTLEAAETGDEHALAEYFKLADKVVEREMHTAGVVNGLVLAIAGLPHKAIPRKGDKSLRARKLADEITGLMQPSSALRLAAPGLISQGLTHSIAVASVAYQRTATIWTPVDFIQKPSHFFTFDRADGRTPLLRNAVAGQPASPIDPSEALVFTPRRNSAMQIKNGLAWILCWAYVIKSLVMADQTMYLQNVGHPLIFGTYKRNTSPEDISLLQRAVSAINSSFRAVYRDDLTIDFKDFAKANGTDMFEKLIRYLDESISKVVWASTLTTDGGGGGTYALGKVHAEGKYDVIRALAQQWSAGIQVWADAYVEINYGPDAPKVQVIVDIEEAEDLVAGSQIVKNLSDAGVTLVASEIRERFGFREPQEGEEVIGGAAAALPAPAPAAAPGAAKNSRQYQGCPEHSPQSVGAPIPRDAIDDLADAMLSDWTTLSADIDANLSAVAMSANSLEEMRVQLHAAVTAYDDSALLAMLTKARTKTRLAGDAGAEV